MNICTKIDPEPRSQQDHTSLTNWLLPKHRQQENDTHLPGFPNPQVFCPLISSQVFTLSSIQRDDTRQDIFPFSIIPDPTTIPGVSRKQVWDVLMDFKNYHKWNAFQKSIKILEPYEYGDGKDSNVVLEMKTDEFGIVREQILYIDEKRLIFIYGYVSRVVDHSSGEGQFIVHAMRAQWLTQDTEGNVVYHSINCFKSGMPLWITRLPCISSLLLRLWNEQHEGLRDYIIDGTNEE